MALDHAVYHTIHGKYTHMTPTAPPIPHPVIALPGNRFYCLSTSPAADGTRAEDWYQVNYQGVRPVCSCRAWNRKTGCKHIALVTPQIAPLQRAMVAQWEAERQARRGQTTTEGNPLPPPPPGVSWNSAPAA